MSEPRRESPLPRRKWAAPWRITQQMSDGRVVWSRPEALPDLAPRPFYRYWQFISDRAVAHSGGFGTWSSADRDGSGWAAHFGSQGGSDV